MGWIRIEMPGVPRERLPGWMQELNAEADRIDPLSSPAPRSAVEQSVEDYDDPAYPHIRGVR